MMATDLERCQRNCWQRRGVIIKRLRSGDSALELNMCPEIVRCELNVAVLDVIDDTFGKVEDALGRVGARMIGSSNDQ